jgi:hypothetical protein
MTAVDTSNTDQKYWEQVLSEFDLSVDEEIPQPVEITAEQFKEISNVELLPEEDYESEEPVVNYNGITRDTVTHSGLSETNEELRTKVDGDDPFFEGHGIVKPRRGNAGDRTGIPRTCPEWALDNTKIQKILLLSFPKLTTDGKQRASAGRWARVIQLYFKSQMTHGQIASEMGLSLNNVKMIVRAIKLASKGLSTATGKARVGRIGRPKKS